MAIQVDQHLQDWSQWLFRQPGGVNNNAADDLTGGYITNDQKLKQRWFIPGTWGAIQTPVRTIVVPNGASLYIVAGSSHATDEEVDTARGDTLESYALWADKLFDKGVPPYLTIDGHAAQLTTVKTNSFPVQFANDNPYVTKNNLSNTHQNMVSVARIHEFTPTKEKSFTILGSRPEDRTRGKNGEALYELHVKYKIARPGAGPTPPTPPGE